MNGFGLMTALPNLTTRVALGVGNQVTISGKVLSPLNAGVNGVTVNLTIRRGTGDASFVGAVAPGRALNVITAGAGDYAAIVQGVAAGTITVRAHATNTSGDISRNFTV